MEDQQKINELLAKLEQLLHRQDQFQLEINQLRNEIFSLQNTLGNSNIKERLQVDPLMTEEVATPVSPPSSSTPVSPPEEVPVQARRRRRRQAPKSNQPKTPGFFEKISSSLDFEKFIGENLFSTIGVLITFIGVVIGVRLAIENEMISPLTRIILGYLVGFGLLGTALKLKTNYARFSAVLLSGAMAILYFITFSAYSFYGLIPQLVAFGLMALFTIFTVIAALNYDKQVIAIIGLVGAYGVPFLVSSGSGNYLAMFSYIALINIGILVIAFRKTWKPLYYSAFVFTWLIFGAWTLLEAKAANFGLGIGFAFLFFLLFYATFLAYKLIRLEELEIPDIFFILVNSFLFFGFGYYFCGLHPTWGKYLGLFALFNAIPHFMVSMAIFQNGMAKKNIFYLISGMVLVFLTIAIPIQLDGNWVTLLWIGEATLLFWIGRSQKVAVYEQLSLGLMGLAIASLAQDWSMTYGRYYITEKETFFTPFLNIHLLSSLLFAGGLGAIFYLKDRFPSQIKSEVFRDIPNLIPFALVSVLFGAFFLEISEYWGQAYILSEVEVTSQEPGGNSYTRRDFDLVKFQSIWLSNYTMLFCSLLIFAYHKWFRNPKLDLIVAGLGLLSLLGFLVIGLYEISELRQSYLYEGSKEYFVGGPFYIYIRYISLALCAVLLFALHKIIRPNYPKVFELLLAGTILWIASAEFINLSDLFGATSTYKIGLSILWGVFSLLLVGIGIGQKKRHLRVAGIALFGLTLVKLFLYDLVDLDTIAKTIVLVSLGILLLIISFLYNKFQIGEDETN